MSTPTPRTDAVVAPYVGQDGVSVEECDKLLDHARQLERELAGSKRCEDCNCELTACGDPNPDGTPSDDCPVCRSRSVIDGLRRELKEVRKDHESQFRVLRIMAEEVMEKHNQLISQLTAHKAALVKAREALEDAAVGNVIVWRSASTGGCVSPIQEALTAINEVLEEKK